MPSIFDYSRCVAAPGFNRWLVPPVAIAVHLCIGTVYSWSIYNSSLDRVLGVVAPAPGDWGLDITSWVFSLVMVISGFTAAIFGLWVESSGPRKVISTAAACWGGGMLLGATGVFTHQLWLLFLGYGVLGGCGVGLGYVAPIGTLIRWFPDRRGLATGLAIMGFGGGAFFGAPLKEALLARFFVPPAMLGTQSELQLETDGGRRFAVIDAARIPVVVLGELEAKALKTKPAAGVYKLGTGSSGLAETMYCIGGLVFVVMLTAAFLVRVPPAGWKPEGWSPPDAAKSVRMLMATGDVSANAAIRTPQFWCVWIALCMNVTAGLGLIGSARTIVTDIFGLALPTIVTTAFTAGFVQTISLFNIGGRLAWTSLSDVIGRKTLYTVFFALGSALYFSIPFSARGVAGDPNVVWLATFSAAVMLIISMYGGGFAACPAYLADLFGTKNIAAIHGRLLTAWSVAAVLGQAAVNFLRDRAIHAAIRKLASVVPPDVFEQKFGDGVEHLDRLVKFKTVTIAKLLEVAPSGTVDPRITMYDEIMFLMAGLLVIGLVANLMVRPVADRHFLAAEQPGE